jgi:shikimate dehydrogenase
MTAFKEWRDAEPGDFAVIGDPIGHSLSPRMHQAAYEALGLPYRYVALRVPSGEVAQCLSTLAALGYKGVNVTVPHKEETFRAMHSVEPFAGLIGAVNTVKLPEMRGTNTDGPGFMDTLADLELPGPPQVLVLGAGGSALAVVAALAGAGYKIRLYNRTQARAESLVARLGAKVEILPDADPADCDLLVNTTSAGLKGEQLPILWARVKPTAVAYDLVYGRKPTPFLRSASDCGLRTMDGLPLLVAQGARSIEWWLGVKAPQRTMLENLKW